MTRRGAEGTVVEEADAGVERPEARRGCWVGEDVARKHLMKSQRLWYGDFLRFTQKHP